MTSVYKEWTCIFPGKLGLYWKRAWDGICTKEEAELQASKNCNVISVPVQLFEYIKEIECRMVSAEALIPEKNNAQRMGLLADGSDPW